jgi:hypothetical protein
VRLLWEIKSETAGHNEVSDLIKITQICVKIKAGQEEERIRQMWEYLTTNYCSEVLIE